MVSIVRPPTTSPTAVRTCEACWSAPVEGTRTTADGTDLVCRACAIGQYPRRVDLFPPFGIYKLTERKKQQPSKPPQMPRDPGPALPPGRPVQSPPGTPPV
ncbi:hypothetical protein [[Kitasatospora] papulosa]|uniref:hypothetical protein n=1 Tax=[Kitasatospora] papulosa TaxID=1464011 RepID=UPI003626C57E